MAARRPKNQSTIPEDPLEADELYGGTEMPATTQNMAPIWQEYKQSHDPQLRETLLVEYLPLVKFLAERIHVKLPEQVELEDLQSAGAFALLGAIENFDPSRGIKFETFCSHRVRGAIIDELRRMDWVPRMVRNRATKMNRTVHQLTTELGRPPDTEEIAKKMDIRTEECEEIVKETTGLNMISLYRTHYDRDNHRDVEEIDFLSDPDSEDPIGKAQQDDLLKAISKGLNRAERLVLILYYYEEMTMKEIGMVLDLCESRISQMHTSILGRLRSRMVQREMM